MFLSAVCLFFVGLLLDDETQIWLGNLRVVGCCDAVVTQIYDHCVTYVFEFLDASLSVRTKP